VLFRSEQDMEILKEAGNLKPTLKDIKNLKITRTKSILSRIFIISVISLVALAIVALLVIWCFFRDLLFKVPCIKKKLPCRKKRRPHKNEPIERPLLDISTPLADRPVYFRVPRWEMNEPPSPRGKRHPPPPVPRMYPSLPYPSTPRITYASPYDEKRSSIIRTRHQPIYSEIPTPNIRKIIVHQEM
jgi:hypothetical protein